MVRRRRIPTKTKEEIKKSKKEKKNMPNINIPLNFSKNIFPQIFEWQKQYVQKLVSNDIPLYEAIEKSLQEVDNFINANWENETFRNKYADDAIEIAQKDPELLNKLWEEAQRDGKKKINGIIDKYNEGKISKEEMEKELKYHSIIFKIDKL